MAAGVSAGPPTCEADWPVLGRSATLLVTPKVFQDSAEVVAPSDPAGDVVVPVARMNAVLSGAKTAGWLRLLLLRVSP